MSDDPVKQRQFINSNNQREPSREIPNMSALPKQRWYLPKKNSTRIAIYMTFGILFSIGSFYGVWYSIESEKSRRHTSIARDIEREKWRRKQLGLPEKDEYDDGFADQYESMEVNQKDVELAKRSIEETARTLGKN